MVSDQRTGGARGQSNHGGCAGHRVGLDQALLTFAALVPGETAGGRDQPGRLTFDQHLGSKRTCLGVEQVDDRRGFEPVTYREGSARQREPSNQNAPAVLVTTLTCGQFEGAHRRRRVRNDEPSSVKRNETRTCAASHQKVMFPEERELGSHRQRALISGT